ncbi:MAG: hypothetical protein JW995_00470 [Melioribacteraceae bacterium]|nr:hypothetical protein [Melioribacteraceae bacterium]
MDFLDNLVLPQSSHHMILLKYLLVLTYLIFIPYLSVLIGTNILSVYFNRKADQTGERSYYNFTREIIDIVTFNKVSFIALGFVPLVSAALCYAQLLHLSEADVTGYLVISLIMISAGFILLFSYKNSFHLKDLVNAATSSHNNEYNIKHDVEVIGSRAERANKKYGVYSLVLFALSAYVFIGAVKYASDPLSWGSVHSILDILLSFNTFVGFLYFTVAAIFITSAVILYIFSGRNDEASVVDETVKIIARKVSLSLGLVSAILLPLFLLLNTVLIPESGLNNASFLLLIVMLLTVLLSSGYFYLMIRNSDLHYSSFVLFLVIVFVIAATVKDQYAFDTSTQNQFIKLTENYTEYQKNLKEELGLSVETISGADIYNGRCIACHQFENKLVGPPYNDILQKYEGKKEQLVQFILNPVKVDPNYPPMPNQGLKPKEAEAVTDYIIKVYEEQYKK